jgi:hypothetical protein
MIFNDGDDGAGFATSLNASNFYIGSAGTKQRETHSPKKVSNGEWCTQRSNGKYTYRWIQKPHG